MSDVVPRIRIPLLKAHKDVLIRTLDEGEFVIGHDIHEFSEELAKCTGRKYCLLTANGFSALFLAIRSMGLEGKRIAVPAASTCFAILNAIRSSRNTPVFIDNDLSNGNASLDELEWKFKNSEVEAAILPSHFGIFHDRETLRNIALPIIEDNAQAILSSILFASSAEVMTLSFYPTKILNGIDGGAVLTDNPKIYKLCRDIVYYAHQQEDDGVERYNMRMTNLNAAFGRITLKELPSYGQVIAEAIETYFSVVDSFPEVKVLGDDARSRYLLSKFVLKFTSSHLRNMAEKALKKKGVGCSKELFLLTKKDPKLYPNATKLVDTTLSVPLRESLTAKEIDMVSKCLMSTLTEII
jgi:dTDP-4-amino-4,6-dideoxygalactose transaminase